MVPILVRRGSPPWQIALALLGLVVAVGVLGYMLLAHLSFVDALYQTVITLATIGYQDVADVKTNGSPLVRLFTVFLIVVGLGVAAYGFSIFIRSLFEGELRDIIGQRHSRRRIRYMKDHFIICGFGRMGEIIAQRLHSEKLSVLVIESNAQKRNDVEMAGFVCLLGDATHDRVLLDAGIERARSLIAVTDSDAENLFVTISARQLNPRINIVSRAISQEAEHKLLRAGANRVILPYKLGAMQLAQAALRPNVVDFIEIATKTSTVDIEIEELLVEASSELAGKTLKEAEILRELGLIIIGIRSGSSDQMLYNPSAQTSIQAGDTLIALGKPDKLAKVRRFIQ